MEIPEIKLELNPKSEEAKSVMGFRWARPEIGKRSKFGGQPDWLQGPDEPICSCGKEMTFYAQLDSTGDDVVLADCGMIYVFVCFDCLETKSILQSY